MPIIDHISDTVLAFDAQNRPPGLVLGPGTLNFVTLTNLIKITRFFFRNKFGISLAFELSHLFWVLGSNLRILVLVVEDEHGGCTVVLFLPRPSNRVRNCLCKVRSSNYRRVQSTRRSRSFHISWRQSIYI
jgi:hypothetical protein